MSTGTVFDIQRFCTHDGPGIRTVVFLKGCPLNCAWCHNPESKKTNRELFYNPTCCIGCGNCVDACPAKAHSIIDGAHIFDRTLCCGCLKCVETCYSRALEEVGRRMSAEEALSEVEKDLVFYEESDGGLTLSGGEPMLQFEFSRELLHMAHAKGIHTCMETCGFAPGRNYIEILPDVDLFLWDIKDTDPIWHKRNTGAALEPILENLEAVDKAEGRTLLRCILISGVNASEQHIDAIADIYMHLRNCIGVEFLPYHELGNSKFEKLGIEADFHSSWVIDSQTLASLCEYMQNRWNIVPICLPLSTRSLGQEEYH